MAFSYKHSSPKMTRYGWRKAICQEGSACTIFAPSDQAFVDLGDKRRMQFMDDHNKETVEKIASYPVIGELVSGLQRQELALCFRWTSYYHGRRNSSGSIVYYGRNVWFWGQGRWRSHHQWSQSDGNYKYQ
jgi:hypothetical protein